ncbi:hypothetical protein [Nocardia sp. NPDC005825]|uniref:hypothetical protein n=1 Tax=unclassified Nocardia TaxID=2637762 RepID=UPI0033D1AD0E
MQTQDSTSPTLVSEDVAAEAIALVRIKAPDSRFGTFVARHPAGGGKYIQVNRVNGEGMVLVGGWTFLVDLTKRVVVRTAVDPDSYDPKSAVRQGTTC